MAAAMAGRELDLDLRVPAQAGNETGNELCERGRTQANENPSKDGHSERRRTRRNGPETTRNEGVPGSSPGVGLLR